MKTEIAKQWTEALRSKKYEQGTGTLCSGGRYCCLGVLCELAVEAGVVNKNDQQQFDYALYGQEDEQYVCPAEVIEWAGLHGDCGVQKTAKLDGFDSPSLANLNDRNWTFDEIADVIEANVECL